MNFFGYSKLTQDQAKLFIIDCYMGVLKRYPEKDVLERGSLELSSGKKTCAEFLSGVVYSKEFRNISGDLQIRDLTKSYTDFNYFNKGVLEAVKNIIYLGFSVNRPIGGMKVILHHIKLINSMSQQDVAAQVFFPENSNFNLTWMDIDVSVKRDHAFDQAKDLVIVPEMWALYYGKIFKSSGLRYGIFVQNGYLIYDELQTTDKSNLSELRDIYSSASIILSISNDVTKCLSEAYPEISTKICQIKASVDSNLFQSAKVKKNRIGYMPRKLSSHSAWVVARLNEKIPNDWEIIQINNMVESQVAHALSESKIFMSFSDREGLGLPPLEAAVSGNRVIGYTGQAGKEYWSGSIFHEIECGDLIAFVDAVMDEVYKLKTTDAVSAYPEFLYDMKKIADDYSPAREKEALKKLLAMTSDL